MRMPLMSDIRSLTSGQPRRAWPAVARRLGEMVAYGLAFTALHRLAALWSFGMTYSLWFPAAGLRFAFLWWAGPAAAPGAALAELAMQVVTGELDLGHPAWLGLIGALGPALVYGAVIHVVRKRAGRRTPLLRIDPMPFALAGLIGPFFTCLTSLPWALANDTMGQGVRLLENLLTFTLGDMLGVMTVAPPLIWLTDRLSGTGRWTVAIPSGRQAIEAVLLSGAALAAVFAIRHAGLGLQVAPLLLSTCWIGLRCGRIGAWASIVVATAMVLPLSADLATLAEALDLHLMLACIAAAGYLTGSFAEAEARSHEEIQRRDRMLYQAERLKTLRAMSVAVIHEVSQPLSTIAIEAQHLRQAVAAPSPDADEIATTADLIARKADDLSRLVRRLRRFGDRAADAPSPIPAALIVADAAAIAAPEAKARRVTISVPDGIEGVIDGQDIELRQMLLNLLRNAIAASPEGGTVSLAGGVADGRVHLAIDNAEPFGAPPRAGAGMGVGLIIARSIAEAHGGLVTQDRPRPGHVRSTVSLPASGGPDA